MSKCPKRGCDYESSDMGVKIHHKKKHGESISGFKYKCASCGETIIKRSSKYEKGFCSNNCMNKWQSNHWSGENNPNFKNSMKKFICEYCGEKYHRHKSYKEQTTFCSRSCSAKWRSENLIGEESPVWNSKSKTCQECGDKFYASESEYDRRKFCSYQCHNDNMYKGGNIRYGKGWTSKRKETREKYDHRCAVCDEECQEVCHHVHHIIPVRQFEEHKNAHYDENLVLLCNTHHMRFENKSISDQSETLNRNPYKDRP